MNGLWVTTLSAVRTAVKTLTSTELLLNEGFNRPIKLIAPEGCVYNARPTVPCFLCGNISGTIGHLINKALCNVLPEKIPASSGADVIGQGFIGVDPRTGKYWGTLTPCLVGQGADHVSDGDSYLLGATQNIPTEILESTYSLLVEKSELIQDSGGGGYGDPLERPIETVRTDVIKGYISVEFARQEYGVVIDPKSFEVDNTATQKLRGDLSKD